MEKFMVRFANVFYCVRFSSFFTFAFLCKMLKLADYDKVHLPAMIVILLHLLSNAI